MASKVDSVCIPADSRGGEDTCAPDALEGTAAGSRTANLVVFLSMLMRKGIWAEGRRLVGRYLGWPQG